jgi:hypothetical protein
MPWEKTEKAEAEGGSGSGGGDLGLFSLGEPTKRTGDVEYGKASNGFHT